MKEWMKVSLFLCLFGFIREIRPSENYMSVFILGPWRNITSDQLNREIFPVGTYSYLAQSFIVFLITDYLRYKPLIIVIGISGIIVSSLLIWTTSLLALQIMEFCFGTFMAAEVAYYTYIYAKVDKIHYPKVTSHTRAAMFAGKMVASISSQILISCKLMDYMELNYITFATQIIATVWAFMLPNVKDSLYFHRETKSKAHVEQIENGKSNQNVEDNLVNVSSQHHLSAFQLLWYQFKSAYRNRKVVLWSVWYAFGLGGYLQFMCYIQVLWNDIDENPPELWNGAVDAALTGLGTCFALIAGVAHFGKLVPRKSFMTLALLSFLQGGSILFSCLTRNLYCAYAGYIMFGALYSYTITVTSAEVARHLEEDSYGLVFGINTVGGLLLQTFLTLAVVEDIGFKLNVIGQYSVYGYYFIGLGLLYFLYVLLDYFWLKQENQISNTNISNISE